MTALVKAAPNLKYISLHNCEQLSNLSGLEACNLSKLEIISLFLQDITEKGLKNLLEVAPSLKEIHYERDGKSSPLDIDEIVEAHQKMLEEKAAKLKKRNNNKKPSQFEQDKDTSFEDPIKDRNKYT